jgi:aminomethyltransferase
MVVSRTGYSGELGYELYYPRDYAEHIWDSVAAAGAEAGIAPCGLGALRTVRMEKRYPLYGLDVNEGTSPLEAGLGWAVDLDGPDFIGREALLREREGGPNRTLIGIDLGDLAFVASPGDDVRLDGRSVGTVTSGERGHFLGKSLAMAYVSPQVTAGTEVTVVPESSGSGSAGVVADRPFYDPDGARVRA